MNSFIFKVWFAGSKASFNWEYKPSFDEIQSELEKRFGFKACYQILNDRCGRPLNESTYTSNIFFSGESVEYTLTLDPCMLYQDQNRFAKEGCDILFIQYGLAERTSFAKNLVVEKPIFIFAGNTKLFCFKADINSTVKDVESFLRELKEYSVVFDKHQEMSLMYRDMYLQRSILLIDLLILESNDSDGNDNVRLDICKPNLSIPLDNDGGVYPIEILSPQQIAEKKEHFNEVYNIPISEQLLYQVLSDDDENTDDLLEKLTDPRKQFENQIKLICYYTEDSSLVAIYRELNIPMLKPVHIFKGETGELLLTIDFKYEHTLDIPEIIYRRLNIIRSKQVLITRNLERCCLLANLDLIQLNLQTKEPFLSLFIHDEGVINEGEFPLLQPYSFAGAGKLLWMSIPNNDPFEITVRFLTSQIEIDIGGEQLRTIACLKRYLFEQKHVSVHLQRIMHNNGEELNNDWDLRKLTNQNDALNVIIKPDTPVTLHLHIKICILKKKQSKESLFKDYEVTLKETSTVGELKELISQLLDDVPITSIFFLKYRPTIIHNIDNNPLIWRPENLELWQSRSCLENVYCEIQSEEKKKRKNCVLV